MALKRGFRAACERQALDLREQLGLEPSDPIELTRVAKTLGAEVVAADELVEREKLAELERLQAFAFSAVTFELDNGRRFIVFNPLHSHQRIVSDIAHELAHLLLQHELTEVREVSGIPFRTCRTDQEEEATAFAAILLLPRPLLLRAAREGMNPEEIAARFRVTAQMARYRYNTSGVARQIAAMERRRPAASRRRRNSDA